MSRTLPAGAARTPVFSPGRIVGVDVARMLAVAGMFAAHLGAGTIGLLDGDAAWAEALKLLGELVD